MKKNLLIVIALLSVMAGALAACGKDGGAQGSGENPKTKAEEGHEPITITRFNNLITENFLDALHEVYPEINLQIVSYGGKNGSGYAQFSMEMDDMTDIYVSTQNFNRELQPERLIDLSVYDFVNNYSTFMLNSLDVDGGIYLLPTGYSVAGMWYNKTIMEENGWAVPSSFEELTALAPKIEAAGYQPFANSMDLDGYPFNYFFSIGNTGYFSTQEGVQWKEDFPDGAAPAAGNEGLEEAARYYNEWIENGIITGRHTSIPDYQGSGKIVFYLCLGLTQYEYEADDGKTYEFGIMPWLSRDGSNNMLTRNVSRYFGVNKRLEEPGNEQKLEDALHVLEFVSSEAGQAAIMSSTNIYMTPLSGGEMAEDNPYQEVADVMNSGHTMQMVYVGWEELIIPIAEDIRALIKGDISADGLLEEFDKTYDETVRESSGSDIYGVLAETLTYEETAKLCAVSEGKAVDADCAMVSLNEYHGDDLYNNKGIGWYLWEGGITTERIQVIQPNSDIIAVLEMTGAEIKEMQKAGFDVNKNGNPYDYVLVTRGGAELDDDTSYRMAAAADEIPEEMLERAEITEVSPETAIKEYVSELGTFGAEDIVWTE